MSENGTTPAGTAEKQLGDIVGDVTSKASLLVSEEIALAGFFALMMLIFLLHTLAWGFSDWFGLKTWVGYAITTGLLLLFTGLSALIGLRMVKKGSPPTPQMAIEEAKKTQAAIKEARS